MAQRRKLLVFVSSTYTDLKEERQAAVEAILKAGHIPAGMELFAATDKSQMDVIKKWIDECDAYMLLLGGRYGSIEPNSGKSYTQLEYEYAVEKGKAFFSVVINEDYLNQKVTKVGKDVLELDNPEKYRAFYANATAKMVEFWSDLRDIKLAVHTTLAEFSSRPELVGWVPGNEVTNSGAIAEEIARLAKENADLRAQLSQSIGNTQTFNGLSFNEVVSLLSSEIDKTEIKPLYFEILVMVAHYFNYTEPSILHFLWLWHENDSFSYFSSMENDYGDNMVKNLSDIGFVVRVMKKAKKRFATDIDREVFYGDYKITDLGRSFLLKYKVLLLNKNGLEEILTALKRIGDISFEPLIKRTTE